MELQVEGMSCGGCVSSVKRILARQLGLEPDDVEVDLDGRRARIPDDSDAAKLDEAFTKLEKAGFPTRRA